MDKGVIRQPNQQNNNEQNVNSNQSNDGRFKRTKDDVLNLILTNQLE